MIIGTGISPFALRRGGSSYGAYTSAYYAVVLSRGGSLTSNELTYLTTFENALGAGLSNFDRLGILGLQNQIAATTSFVNPSSTALTLVNSPTFTAGQGFAGNGTTMRIDTNYNPVSGGVNFTLNNGSLFVYSRTNANAFYVDLGHFNGTTAIAQMDIRDAGNFYFNINEIVGTSNEPVANSLGLFSGIRTASNQVKSYKNGVLLETVASNSVALINNNMYLLARNNNGTAGQFSTRQLSMYAIGNNSVDQAAFYTAVQALGTSMGWSV
jgi:hypothetical protein